MQQTSPQGIDAILQALAVGGQPTGQIGKLPSPVNPQAQLAAQAALGTPSGQGQVGQMPAGMPQSGATDPLQAALMDANPEQLNMILEALLRGGAFNQQVPAG